jgi:CDP-diacylglycerol--glycerol-3-phosphate 3-phosphatidyltransferase
VKQNYFTKFQSLLENIDAYRDKAVLFCVGSWWPKRITPNFLSWLRVGIALVLFVLLFSFDVTNKWLIIILFIIGALTDLLDGSLARGRDMVTEFGALLDPTADRLLLIPIAFYSLWQYHQWLVVAIVTTEIINTLVSLFYHSKEIYKESNIYGKTRMVIQCIIFVVILISFPAQPPIFFIYLYWFSLLFTFLSIFTRIIELKAKGHFARKPAK